MKAGDTEKKGRSLPLQVGPLNPAWGSMSSSSAVWGRAPGNQVKSNLVHYFFKIWQLMATILMILFYFLFLENIEN